MVDFHLGTGIGEVLSPDILEEAHSGCQSGLRRIPCYPPQYKVVREAWLQHPGTFQLTLRSWTSQLYSCNTTVVTYVKHERGQK